MTSPAKESRACRDGTKSAIFIHVPRSDPWFPAGVAIGGSTLLKGLRKVRGNFTSGAESAGVANFPLTFRKPFNKTRGANVFESGDNALSGSSWLPSVYRLPWILDACDPQSHRPSHNIQGPPTRHSFSDSERACPGQREEADKILQHNIGGWTGRQDIQFKIVPNEHGFVNIMLSVHTGNYALVIRPDDVWLAAISQFSLYVSENPDLLRDEANLVSHEPRKGQSLEIVDPNSQPLSAQIGELMQRTVLDPALRDWVLPNFCTSTPNDITVGSMLWMAPTIKKFFIPNTETLRRGIPRVTLEGRQGDWELLLEKVERLKEYGIPAIAWYHLL
ncbi:hypothetical protein B0H13DRAFT_1863191 [Mycena leptocephala]|nr:hypothetical protein B0H13DRAFT_1863191 [Mycena leptocephala]